MGSRTGQTSVANDCMRIKQACKPASVRTQRSQPPSSVVSPYVDRVSISGAPPSIAGPAWPPRGSQAAVSFRRGAAASGFLFDFRPSGLVPNKKRATLKPAPRRQRQANTAPRPWPAGGAIAGGLARLVASTGRPRADDSPRGASQRRRRARFLLAFDGRRA